MYDIEKLNTNRRAVCRGTYTWRDNAVVTERILQLKTYQLIKDGNRI